MLLVAVVLTTPLGIFVGSSVSQTLHAVEPGLSERHCWNCALQTLLGTVLMYLAISGGGEEPFVQAHM